MSSGILEEIRTGADARLDGSAGAVARRLAAPRLLYADINSYLLELFLKQAG